MFSLLFICELLVPGTLLGTVLLVIAKKQIPHLFLVVDQVLQFPVSRLYWFVEIDVHGPWLCIYPCARVNIFRDADIKWHDWSLQAGREVKRAFIEMANFTRSDT